MSVFFQMDNWNFCWSYFFIFNCRYIWFYSYIHFSMPQWGFTVLFVFIVTCKYNMDLVFLCCLLLVNVWVPFSGQHTTWNILYSYCRDVAKTKSRHVCTKVACCRVNMYANWCSPSQRILDHLCVVSVWKSTQREVENSGHIGPAS